MAYIHPSMVLSPKSAISDLSVIYDGGEGKWSVAVMIWNGEPTLAIRWNGENGSLGHPQSRGIPTWFIIPDDLKDAIIAEITKIKNNKIPD